MVDKKPYTLDDDSISEIIDWMIGLGKEEIQQNISDGIAKTDRVKIIQITEGDDSQSLRWEDLNTFKNEAKTNELYAIAERRIGFSGVLIQRQNRLDLLCKQPGQNPVEVLNIKLLVLLKSPECFIELTDEQKKPFIDKLAAVIRGKIDSKITEIEAALVVENDVVTEEDVDETEDESESVEDSTETVEVEWTDEMVAFIKKISDKLNEDYQSVIHRLLSAEVDRIIEEIKYWINEEESKTVLPLLYKLDIRTFSQLESHDPAVHLELGSISENEAELINAIKYRFGK